MLRKLRYALPVAVVALVAGHRLLPGLLGDGVILLPSGWRIHPTGRQARVGALPLNLTRLADGSLVVTDNGYGVNGLLRLDPASGHIRDSVPLRAAWVGLDHRGTPVSDTVWASGGSTNRLYRVIFTDSGHHVDSVALGDSAAHVFVGGVALVPGRDLVAAVGNLSDSLYLVDARTLERRETIPVGHRPYTVIADSGHLYVSNWGDSTVETVTLGGAPPLRHRATFVGPHPSSLALRGHELFAALAGVNAVARYDLDSARVTDHLEIALARGAPVGSDPNGLSLAPDGRRLYVALAGNNAVAVVRLDGPAPVVAGLIPVGWYPVAVATSVGGDTLYVANGKGNGSGANPTGTYIGDVITGSVSVLPLPDSSGLEQDTHEVYALSPYANPALRGPARALPPIRHVVYVIRENRTYDQVLGDVPEGNGDAALAIFNDSVTPNAHAIARHWVLFDNFYVDGEVSADGHEWTDRAFAGEYNEKTWPAVYSDRREWDLDNGEDLVTPRAAYLWDAARARGLWVVNFGESVHRDSAGHSVSSLPGLMGITAPEYPGFELEIRDTTRARLFADSVSAWDRRGTFPALVILYLPRDHTEGRRATHPTPRAMVADNDLALGRVVDRLSRSPAWKSMALLALEDDAQDGPDHVDAHRSVLMVASPYARRGVVDSTFYTTSSVVRTIGLWLGLPPLSQYDAGATPLAGAFTSRPDLAPFSSRRNRWPLDELNGSHSRSGFTDRDFSHPDQADEHLLNREIWASVRPFEPLPAPRRTYLPGRPNDADGDGDDH